MSMITVRQIEKVDKDWLKAEANRAGISMEEFVRRMIREKRIQTTRRPSEIVAECFGEKHGFEPVERLNDSVREVNFEADE